MATRPQTAFAQRVTYESLPPLCSVMAVFYALMALAHWLVLPAGNARLIMVFLALATSVLSLGVRKWLSGTERGEQFSSLLVIFLMGLVLVNCLAHMALFRDASQSPLFALAIAGAGYFVASIAALLFIIAAIVGGWLIVYISLGDFTSFDNYLFLIVMAVAASITINIARIQNLRRLEAERLAVTQQLQLAGQSHRLYLERVLQSLEPGLCAVDGDNNIALVNRAFADLIGQPEESLTGQSLKGALIDLDWGASLLYEIVQPVDIELGLNRTITFSETVLPNPDAKSDGRLIVAVDISSRKHLEAEREQLLRAVSEAQRLESLGILAGGIAHDFNNLLAIILGSLEMLGLQNANDEHIESATTAAHKAADLTRQLLAHAGNDTEIRKPLNVSELLAGTIKLLRSCTPSGIEFVSRIDAPEAQVMADRLQLQQVFVNIAMNAAEAYPDGMGSVSVTVTELQNELDESSFIEIKFSDNGSGINADVMSRLYTPFATTKGPGRGLGLSASLGIVQRHGGELDIRSAGGAGTTVCVLLPSYIAHHGQQEKIKLVANSQPVSLSQKSLWVVDDEPEILVITKRIAEAFDMAVSVFETPQAVLDRFRGTDVTPDVIVIDVNMPSIDGLQLFAELRALSPLLPVVMISGYDKTQVADTIVARADRVSFVKKPFETDDLIDAVREVLKG